jgi:hypothetical protein
MFDTPGAFPDQPIAGVFSVHGDTLVRCVYNDTFSLNYVYEFEGPKLKRAIPYAQWLVEHMPESEVTLYRQMGPRELGLWKEKRFKELGADWGHGKKVTHFSTSGTVTSAAGPRDNPIVKTVISKSALLELAKRGELWSAAIDHEETTHELVLPAEELERLSETGNLKIITP